MADISRAEVATLIQEAYADVLLDGAREASTALSAFPTISMGTKLTHLPVLATLPEAGWVSESATDAAGVKPQSQATWTDRTLVAEEIAVILPIHENVIDDANTAVLTDLASLGGQAIGKKLDQAIFFGTDKPASWVSDDLLTAAVAASQDVTVVGGQANSSDIVGAVNQVSEKIATAGYAPDTMVASLAMRYQVANLRNADGSLVFRDESFAGYRTFFNRNGAWAPSSAVAIVADSSRVRIGVRQDIQVKLLDQATVGSINLAERDMVAIRLKARFAYVLGNGATPAGADKTPVGVVLPASGS